MDIRTGSIDFSATLRGSGPRVSSQTIVFPRQILSGIAGISGYAVGYSGDDHHVGMIDIQLETIINANTLTVNAKLGLRDWSGDWDDNYNGSIDFTVLADLESATAEPPRGDLSITGMEMNQAVQFFRSGTYLDLSNQQPDNAIWMVARKNTGIRVYSDYDADAGLPPISRLTGDVALCRRCNVRSGRIIVNADQVQIEWCYLGEYDCSREQGGFLFRRRGVPNLNAEFDRTNSPGGRQHEI